MFKEKVIPENVSENVSENLLEQRDEELKPFHMVIFGSIFINTLSSIIVVLCLALP